MLRPSPFALVAILALCGVSACQKAGEAALSAATGGAVDLKNGSMTVTDEKGQKVVIKGADGTGQVTVTGPDGQKVVMSGAGQDGTITVTGPQGQMKAVAGENVALPAECPLTLAAGYQAVTVQGGANPAGKKTCMVMAKGAGATAEVAAFYDVQLKGLGFTVSRNDMKMDQMETTMLAGKKGESVLNVSIMRDAQGSSIQILGEGL